MSYKLYGKMISNFGTSLFEQDENAEPEIQCCLFNFTQEALYKELGLAQFSRILVPYWWSIYQHEYICTLPFPIC